MVKSVVAVIAMSALALILNVAGNIITPSAKQQLGILGQFFDWVWVDTLIIIALSATIAILVLKCKRQVNASTESNDLSKGTQIELDEPEYFSNETLSLTYREDDDSTPTSALGGNPDSPTVKLNLRIDLYRIPVTNQGGSNLNVAVKLVETRPSLRLGLPQPTLHRAGDNPMNHRTYEKEFMLAGGQTEHVDVVAIHKDAPHKCYLWSIASQDAVEEHELSGRYIFAIGVFTDGHPVQKDYQIDVDALHGNFTMIRL